MLLLAMIAAAAPSAADHADQAPLIVVQAPRITEADLKACLARNCGTVEDARASIRHAQAQFANGLYADARRTLWSSLGRNRRAVGQEPVAVSALYTALARVTLHNGDLDEYRRMSIRSAAVLARAEVLSEEQRIGGLARLGDAYSALEEMDHARGVYRQARERAEAAGLTELVDLMRVREAWAKAAWGRHGPGVRELTALSEDASLGPAARRAAALMAASLGKKDGPALAALLDRIGEQGAGDEQTLAWSPKAPTPTDSRVFLPTLEGTILYNNHVELPKAYEWVDFGFWVRPDGRVADVELVGGKKGRSWADGVARMIAGRRYAPFRAGADSPGRYVVERVTLTYDQAVPIGSLVRRRVGQPRFHFERLREDRLASAVVGSE